MWTTTPITPGDEDHLLALQTNQQIWGELVSPKYRQIRNRTRSRTLRTANRFDADRCTASPSTSSTLGALSVAGIRCATAMIVTRSAQHATRPNESAGGFIR